MRRYHVFIGMPGYLPNTAEGGFTRREAIEYAKDHYEEGWEQALCDDCADCSACGECADDTGCALCGECEGALEFDPALDSWDLPGSEELTIEPCPGGDCELCAA